MQDRVIEILLVVLLTVVGLFILVAVMDWVLPDAAPLNRWADIVLALVTIVAILVGGLFAAEKFELFRESEPHLTITHAINHRRWGDGYIHIDVKATLQNSSRVRVELNEGFYLLQQVSPVPGDIDYPGENLLYPPWPILDEASFNLGDNSIVLEPNQSLQEVFQFMVPNYVETLLIHYILYASDSTEGLAKGWGITEVYDIIGDATQE